MRALAGPETLRENEHGALRSRRVLVAALASFALAAALMLPVLNAGFHEEDFGWLALARLSPSPWPLLAHNINFVYFYRPLPLLLWWLSAHAFGTDAVWHNALDVVLHALNAALVCVLAARVSGRAGAGALAGLLFASLPAGVATAAWMSDRFDTVALAFSLLALLGFEIALRRPRHVLWPGLWLLLALLSKEVAYAAVAAMLAVLAVHWWRRRIIAWGLLAAVVLAPLCALALRVLSGTTVGASLDIDDPLQAVAAGIRGWWRQAPSALNGFAPASPLLAALFAVLLMVTIWGVLRARGKSAAPVIRLALIGTGLLLVPAILQWPVTAPVLIHDESRAFTVNLRFYYAATAGLALLIAAGYAALPTAIGRAAMLSAGLLTAICAGALSYRLGSHWANELRGPSQAYLALGTELAGRQFPSGCRIYLETPAWTGSFRHHADTIVKAIAPPDASVQACAIFSGEQVYQTFVPTSACTPEQWPGLSFNERNGVPIAGSVGDVCMLQFATYTAAEQLGQPRFRFRVDAHGHAQEIRD
jgi:hypothetical protein